MNHVESPDQSAEIERLLELLAERATEGLNAATAEELRRLLRQFPDLDEHVFDSTAAALELAFALPQQPLPDSLQQSVLRSLDRAHSSTAAENPISHPAQSPPPIEFPAEPPARIAPAAAAAPEQQVVDQLASTEPDSSFRATPKKRPRKREASWPWLPWAAVAAALVVAATAWWPRLQPQTSELSLAQQRAVLMTDGNARLLEWHPSDDQLAHSVSGDVIWSSKLGSGFMRFRGLSSNDPAELQYQLWIRDAERDSRYPVDGGLFDVPVTDDDVIVPVRASLPIFDADEFAVTLEPAGGVVVSERTRLLLTARPIR